MLDLRCTDTAETPRIGGRTRSDTRIRPDTLGYVSRTYQAIFGFLEKENNSDTGRIRMGYVSEGSEGYRTFRLESLGIYAACRDGTTHPICILTFHLGGDDAASDRRQHLLLRCRPVAGEQTPPPSAAGQFPIIPSQFLRFFLVGPARDWFCWLAAADMAAGQAAGNQYESSEFENFRSEEAHTLALCRL
jgi:hypothetical protein